MTRLFIDDERYPASGQWVIVRTSKQAIDWVSANGIPSEISFDHDLGGDDTSRKFVNWLVDELVDGRQHFPDDFTFTVHSQNPIGASWLRSTMTMLIQHFSSPSKEHL